MRYIIIEQSNFDDIERVQAEAKARKDASYKIDVFDNYAHGTFAVIGAKAVQMFCNKYGYTFAGQDTIKTDGKTKAEIIPLLTPSYYYDAREGGRGGLTDIYPHNKIGYLVKYNGVLLDHYKKHYNSEAVAFRLFNDNTDYSKYLPYNWENENPQPNYVGTLTDKKLNDWLNWLTARKNAAEAAKMATNNKISEFLAKVRAFDATGANECVITETRGHIIKNGLRYEYEIDGNGHISEKVRIDYTFVKSDADTLTKFGQMANGDFINK